jgi:hypothetical protein
MVKATPAAPFAIYEPDLALEFLIISLDAATRSGGVDQIAEGYAIRQGRKPVLSRRVLALGSTLLRSPSITSAVQ